MPNKSLPLIGSVILPFLLIQMSFGQPVERLSDDAKVSLLTITPGTELYSTFGHSAIRIVDEKQQMDRLYNYGTFSFEEPGFYLKFVRGKLDYKLSAYPYRYGYLTYRQERRAIIEQTLNLTPEMKREVYQFLEWNYLPENRYYRYDFFFDNCATRIRDAFEKALGERLDWNLDEERKLTFRQYLDLYLPAHPFSDFGMDLGLGAKADRVATEWESMFLPDFLYDSFASATIDINGNTASFVSKTDTLLWFKSADVIDPAPPYPAILLWLLFIAVTVIALWPTIFPAQKSPNIRWLDIILYGVIGLLSLLILFLWFLTDHNVTQQNWNLLWIWPPHLIIAVIILLKRQPKWLRWYFMLNAVAMLLLLTGWKFWPQNFHSAYVPLILTLGFRSGWLSLRFSQEERRA